MLTAAQLEQYQREGFLRGGRVLTDAQAEVLQQEVLRVIETREDGQRSQPVMCHQMGKPEAPIWQIVDIYRASEAFAELLRNATIVSEVAQLLEASEVRLWHDQVQYKPSNKGGVNMWHQDSPYWPVVQPKDAQVTAWVALDDADVDNGCMSMVPGSHKWGDTVADLHKLTAFEAMYKEYRGQKLEVRTCPVPKGHVHFHHSLTWHGSPANHSGRPRRAVALHFMSERTRYSAAGNHVMKPFVTVADGAKIEGEAFPLVWKK